MTDIERCQAEIARCEADLRAGHPEVEGLCLGLADWSAELRILQGVETKSADYVLNLWENRSGAESVASTQQPLSSTTKEVVTMPENRLSHAIDPFDPLKYSIDFPPFDSPELG